MLLHRIEDVFERLYNSLRFHETVKYLHSVFENPFEMYKSLALCLENTEKASSLDDFTLCIYNYFSQKPQINKSVLRNCLAEDRLATNRMGALPEFLKLHSPLLKKGLNYLEEGEDTKRKPGVKRAATLLEGADELIYVDYDKINPVTKRYSVKRIKIEGIL